MKFLQALLTLSALVVGSTDGRMASVQVSASNGPVFGLTQEPKEPFIPGVKSYLSIQIPRRLHHAEHHSEPHRIAQFGLRVARGSMTAAVYYVDESICWPKDLLNNTYPSRGEREEFVRPFFLMAKDEGHCTPVRMARTAQHLGASAVILAERFCRCGDTSCTFDYPHEECLELDVPLVDDGSAGDISIPAIMMEKSWKVENLTIALMNNEPVAMELAWGMAMTEEDLPEGEDITDYKPHYHLWTTSHDPLIQEHTYKHLKIIADGFGHAARFSPRYYLMNGKQFGCHLHNGKAEEDDPCHHLCTNGGRYCASHFSHISGKEIVEETLRRICIYRTYREYPEIHKFYDYSINHIEHCGAPGLFNDTKCIENTYSSAKIAKAEIEMCMKDSGGLDRDVPNGILDQMLKHQEYSGIVQIPSTIVKNGMDVHTVWTGSVFKEICQKFWDATIHSPYYKEDLMKVTVPEICHTCGSCPNVIGCVKAGHCVPWGADPSRTHRNDKQKGGHGWFLTFSIFGALIAGAAYYYYKQREMYGESGAGLLSDYMQMGS